MSNKILIWLNEHFNLLRKVSILIPMNQDNWKPCRAAADNSIPEDLELIFSEMKERLQETVHSAEMHYQRSITVLLLSITVLTSIIGYLSSKFKDFNFTIVNLILIAIAVILVFIVVKLRPNITPQKFDVVGTQAKKLFKEDYFVDLPQGKSAKWLMLYNLIKDYQDRFNDNIVVVNDRAKRIEDSITYLYWIPASAIILLLLGAIFHLDFFS